MERCRGVSQFDWQERVSQEKKRFKGLPATNEAIHLLSETIRAGIRSQAAFYELSGGVSIVNPSKRQQQDYVAVAT